jgi:hypothetical protein
MQNGIENVGKKAGPNGIGKNISSQIKIDSKEKPFRTFQQRYGPDRNFEKFNFEDLPETAEHPVRRHNIVNLNKKL